MLLGVKIFHAMGERFPRFRKRVAPVLPLVSRYSWHVRNVITRRRPVSFWAGPHQISMVAEGHIAEIMWRSEFGRSSFEPAERAFVVNYLQPGMTVLNIGANAGLYALIASKAVGPAGAVHAFEPSSTNYDRLCRNADLNGCRNLAPVKAAVSDTSGSFILRRDPAHPGLDSHFVAERVELANDAGHAMETVAATTVDAYWQSVCGASHRPVDFIIIDVEGAELSVFQGAIQTLAASPNLTMVLECTQHVAGIEALLREQGFSFFAWDMREARLRSVAALTRGSFVATKGDLNSSPLSGPRML